MGREAALASAMVEFADVLVDDFDVVDLLTTLTDRCVEILDVDAAGVMLAEDRGDRLRPVASSSNAIRALELFEEQSEEGPCPDCYRTGLAVTNIDLSAAGGLWPGFGPRAGALGYGSVHALPMRLRGNTIGALNLLRAGKGPLGATDLVVAQAFADAATIAILQDRALRNARQLAEQLQGALESRVLIEQAKGIVSEAVGADMDHAFRLIRQHARNRNQKLTNVAAAIVAKTLLPAALSPFRASGATGPG